MSLHALIIEDDVHSIEVLARLLDHRGASYTALADPRELTQEQVCDFDVVFLDLEMPGMTGYEVYDVLRNNLGCRAPIVAYSVNVNEMATAREIGFDGFIAKPVDFRAFDDQLTRVMAGQGVWEDHA